jgi:hypothetical protein
MLLVGGGGVGAADCPTGFGKALRARYYKTWGCGLPLTPRMEYTATGFVQPIKQVFETIYQPTVKLEREFLEQSKYFLQASASWNFTLNRSSRRISTGRWSRSCWRQRTAYASFRPAACICI